MFAVNFRLSKRNVSVIILALIVVLVGFWLLLRSSSNRKTSEVVKCSDEVSVRDYITSFGYETGDVKVDEITIPDTFNEVYNNYNEIQKSQGFDLTEYKGKTVTRYTYNVTNYPDEGSNVFAEILILNETVIAADIYSTSLDGFISALK